MKLLQFNKDDRFCLAIQTQVGILDLELTALNFGDKLPSTMEELILSGESGLKSLEAFVNKVLDHGSKSVIHAPENVQYGPCVSTPEKIICVGLNYINHAKESQMEIPSSPVLFSKFANALAGDKAIIKLPSDAYMFDYEAELVVVIGKAAKNVSEADALSYVFGYTIGNDLSARDLQFRTNQWLLGKTSDGFAPVGPHIVTADELSNPSCLDIQCKVNGQLRQSANTRDMIFNCAHIISYVSRYMTLKPGDMIFTGTPDGVILGYSENKKKWLKSGDKIEVSIESIGTLTNIMA